MTGTGQRRTFPSTPASAGEARRVDSVLSEAHLDQLVHSAIMLVSELVANAVLHTGTPIGVVISPGGDRVRVEVHDGSPQLPVRKNYSTMSGTGRGLMLVERMAAAWGTTVSDEGKVVWFELSPEAGEATGLALEAEALADLADLGLTGRIDDSGNRGHSGPPGPRPRTRRLQPPGRGSVRR